MEQRIYNDYVRLLERELVPAMGCTEPIALPKAAADTETSTIKSITASITRLITISLPTAMKQLP